MWRRYWCTRLLRSSRVKGGKSPASRNGGIHGPSPTYGTAPRDRTSCATHRLWCGVEDPTERVLPIHVAVSLQPLRLMQGAPKQSTDYPGRLVMPPHHAEDTYSTHGGFAPIRMRSTAMMATAATLTPMSPLRNSDRIAMMALYIAFTPLSRFEKKWCGKGTLGPAVSPKRHLATGAPPTLQ